MPPPPVNASGRCRASEHARDGLSNRDRERLTAHLADCDKCTIVSEEVDEVGSHLAMVMLPLVLGGVAGGSLLASLGEASSASAAGIPIPDVPIALQTMAGSGVLAAPIVGGLSLGAATGAGSLVGGFAVAAVIAGSVALGLAPTVATDTGTTPPPVAVEQQVEQQTDGLSTGAVEGSTPLAGGGLVGDVLRRWARRRRARRRRPGSRAGRRHDRR